MNNGPFGAGSFFFSGGGRYLRFLSYSIGQVLWTATLLASFSLLVLFVVIALAGYKTRRVWQESPPSKLQAWWEKTFFTPRFWLSFFRRWMLWQIERNPVGWLERRRWSGRLVTWAWFAVVTNSSPLVVFYPAVGKFLVGDVIKIAAAAAVLPTGWALLKK